MIAVQNPRDDPGMAACQSRIIRQIPMRCQPVTVKQKQCVGGQWRIELLHPAHQVALAHKQCVLARLRDLAAQAGAHDPTTLAEALLLLMDGAFVARRMFGPTNPGAKVGQAADVLISDAIDGPSHSGRVSAVLQ